MKDYILFLPIIFIFHDMEEIIGFERFFKNNQELFERFPKVTAVYRDFKTDGFALAVYEEFIPFFGISLLAYFFPGKILCALWFSLMLALTLHFVIHIGQSVFIRKYIPSFATSVICLPISILILIKCAAFVKFDFVSVLCIAVGIAVMMINLRFAHAIMRWFNRNRVE
jgi:hypothetical protein